MNAQRAGYGAVVVYNNGSDDVITMHGSMCMELYTVYISVRWKVMLLILTLMTLTLDSAHILFDF